VALAVAMVFYGVTNAAAVAAGVWFRTPNAEDKPKDKPEAVPAAQPS
jgi:hypothetical protein